MATSNSFDYNENADQIVTGAHRELGILTKTGTLDATLNIEGRKVLNTLIKNLAGESIFLWDLAKLVLAFVNSIVVTGTDGNFYECIENHTSANANKPVTGAKHQAYWVQIATTSAAWALSTAYALNSILTNGGNTYVCLKAHTSAAGDEPGVGANTATYWNLLTTWAEAAAYTSIRHYTDLDAETIGVYTGKLREGSTQTAIRSISRMEHDKEADAGDPNTKSEPVAFNFDRKSQPEIYFYPYPDNALDYVFEAKIYKFPDDMDAGGNNPSFLAEWLKPLRLLLAVDLAPRFNRNKGESFTNLVVLAEQAKAKAMGMDLTWNDVKKQAAFNK